MMHAFAAFAAFAAILADPSLTPGSVVSERQAQASVTIMRPARIYFEPVELGSGHDAIVRRTQVRDGDEAKPALFLEFT